VAAAHPTSRAGHTRCTATPLPRLDLSGPAARHGTWDSLVASTRRPRGAAKEETMNWKLIGLGLVLADFTAFSAYALWHYGYVGLFEQAFANLATGQVFVDLCIALSLIVIWMVGDARERGIGVLPYLLATALLGSIGPLLYLIRRERAAARPPVPVAAGTRRVPA
jgi:hypothetical protein